MKKKKILESKSQMLLKHSLRLQFNKNLNVLLNNGLPDLGDILRAGGCNEEYISHIRKCALLYNFTKEVLKAAKTLLRSQKCNECGQQGSDCESCANRILRKSIKSWEKFDKEFR